MTNHLVERLRAHHRLISDQAKILPRRYLGSPFSMVETRLLHELDHQDGLQAKTLEARQGLDKAVISRVLKRFEADGLVARTPSAGRRGQVLALTEQGRAAIGAVRDTTNAHVERMLSHLSARERDDLAQSLERVEALITPPNTVRLRGYRPSDAEAIARAQDDLYRTEYGWNDEYYTFTRDLLQAWRPDPDRERGWIAEMDGRMVGCVLLFDAGEGVAQLRFLHLEREARGRGLGYELVGRFLAAARLRGFRRARLWTQSELTTARTLYAAHGFEIVEEYDHHRFGKDLHGEIWERDV